MLKLMDYDKWKKQFMRLTDRRKGTKIGIRFMDVHAKDVEAVKNKLRDINQKYIEYALLFHSDNITPTKKDVAIVFDRIDLLPEAIRKHKALMVQTSPEWMIPIWIGGYTLYALIDVNDETKPWLKEMQRKTQMPKNYDGILLE